MDYGRIDVLAARAKCGDDDAFALLHNQFKPLIGFSLRLAVGSGANISDAESALLGRLQYAVRTWDSQKGPFANYIKRVMISGVASAIRSERRHQGLGELSDDTPAQVEDVESQIEDQDAREDWAVFCQAVSLDYPDETTNLIKANQLANHWDVRFCRNALKRCVPNGQDPLFDYECATCAILSDRIDMDGWALVQMRAAGFSGKRIRSELHMSRDGVKALLHLLGLWHEAYLG